MPDSLADRAGKTKFLWRKTISPGLDFAPYIKEDSRKWIKIMEKKNICILEEEKNLLPKEQTL